MNTHIGPTDFQLSDMRAHVLAAIAVERAPERSRSIRTTTHRALAVAMIVATVVVVLVLGNVTGILGGAHGGASASAAEVLNKAASLAASQPDPIVQPGQFLRIETHSVDKTSGLSRGGNSVSWLVPSTSVIYRPYDVSDLWILERHQLKPTDFIGAGAQAEAEKEWSRQQSEPLINGSTRAPYGGLWGSSIENVGQLPTDARKLYNHFTSTYRGGSNSPEEDTWVRIIDLLQTGSAPAQLRSALYRAAAFIPGVQITGDDVTLDGHTAVVLGRIQSDRNERQEMLIDKSTGLFVGQREVTLKTQGMTPAGSIVSSSSVTTTVVDTAP